MTDTQTSSNIEYRNGHAAFALGVQECPLKSKQPGESTPELAGRRTAWWDGWLDARTDEALGKTFDKYKLGRMSKC